MFGDFIGGRIKKMREEIFEGMSQTDFATEINEYVDNNYKPSEKESLHFNQILVSVAENKSKIRQDKFTLLLNFLYDTKRINPAWMVIEKNKALPMYITTLVIDSTLVEKQEMLIEYGKKINQTINDIGIVIENSVFE